VGAAGRAGLDVGEQEGEGVLGEEEGSFSEVRERGG
jgi:hypothetical protein